MVGARVADKQRVPGWPAERSLGPDLKIARTPLRAVSCDLANRLKPLRALHCHLANQWKGLPAV